MSLDQEGNVKTWDFKKFTCMQNFSVENDDDKHKFHPQCFTFIPKPLKLVFAGRSINIWEYDKHYNPTSVDDYVVTAVCYGPANNTIITPAGNKIKVWNALNGEVKKVFTDISTSSEVTSFALDYFKKRCIVGFSDGECAVFNVLNGARLKTLSKHTSEVNFVMELHDLLQIITASIPEGTIKFNSDIEVNESEFLRKIDIKETNEMKDSSLSSLAYRPGKLEKDIKMLFIGTHSGVIGFFEADTKKFLGQCCPFPGEEITTMMPHSDLEYVIITTSAGKISIIATPPLPYRFSKVWTFTNMDPELKIPNYINNAIWSNRKRMIFLSDEKSYIRAYDLSKPIEEIIQDKKDKDRKDNVSTYSKHLYAPALSKDDPPMLWISKAHQEPIRAIEYVEEEDLIFTSGMDKRVKMWNSLTGKFVESLQQKYDKFEPIPVSFKKPGIEGIWAPNLWERVDKKYVQMKNAEELEHQNQAARNPFSKLMAQSFLNQMKTE